MISSFRLRRLVRQYQHLNPRCNRKFMSFPDGVAVIQTSLYALKNVTGLPWWLTIASSTIVVRTLIFPLIRTQILETRKLTLAMPELSFLYQLLKLRLQGTPVTKVFDRAKIFSIFIKGVRASFVLHKVRIPFE